MLYLVLLLGMGSVLADPPNYRGVHYWNRETKFLLSPGNRRLVPLSTHIPFNTGPRPVSDYAFVSAVPVSSHSELFTSSQQNDNPWMPPYLRNAPPHLRNAPPPTAWYVPPIDPLTYNYEYDMYSTGGDGGAMDLVASPSHPIQHHHSQPQWSDPSYYTYHHPSARQLEQVHSNIQYVPYPPMYEYEYDKPDFRSRYWAQYRQPYVIQSQFYVDLPWIYIRHLNMPPDEREQTERRFATDAVPQESINSEIADEEGCDVDVMMASETDVPCTAETELQETTATETTVKSDNLVVVVVVGKETETPFTTETEQQETTTRETSVKSGDGDAGRLIQEETETPFTKETEQQETITTETAVKSDVGNRVEDIQEKTKTPFTTEAEQPETATTETVVKCDNGDAVGVVAEETETPFTTETELQETTTTETAVKSNDGVVAIVEEENEPSSTTEIEQQETLVSEVTYEDGDYLGVMLALETDASLKTETELQEITTAESAVESENGDVVVVGEVTEARFSTEIEQQQTINTNIDAGNDDDEEKHILREIEMVLKYEKQYLSESRFVAQKSETLDHVVHALSPKTRKVFENVRDKIPSKDLMTTLDEKIMDMLREYLFE